MTTFFDREEAYLALVALFEKLKLALPKEVSDRLRCGRRMIVHQTRRTQFVFEIYDALQTAALPKNYFKYCVVYDPERLNHPKYDAYFHLWLTTVRIYRGRPEIRELIEREIPKSAPKGFKLEFIRDRAISCGQVFNWPAPSDSTRLAEVLLRPLAQLVSSFHPILMRAIDAHYGPSFSSEERKAEVARRGGIYSGSAPVVSRAKVRSYSRSIPPSWKPRLLEAAGFKCQLCGADLRKRRYHFDHKTPFSHEGGDTVYENLQVLCVACNLHKGNRV